MDDKKLQETVASLLQKGIDLKEVQKILAKDYDHHLTFMELRLLSADIEVNWEQFDPKIEKDEEEKKMPAPPQVEEVEVTKSSVVRPGAMMNGSFVAPSGSSGEWVISSMGQLEVNYNDDTITLTQEETQTFQEKLRELLT